MKKVAMIGLDGMSWDILNKLFQWDVMPNLHDLSDRSVKGTLRSTIPPESAPAWTSIATGVNPGKHGIFGFTKPSEDFSKVELVNSHDVKYLRIHEMVATQNLRSVCVNQLLTYPIKRIKGSSVITDWLSPDIKYSPEIKQYAKDYRGPTLGSPSPKLTRDWDDEYIEFSSRVDAVNKLATNTRWSLFWVVYSEPDHLFHRYYDMVMKKDKRVMRLFRKMDETFGIIKDVADLLFVVSDHGFRKFNYGVYVNTYLEKVGLARRVSKRAIGGIACQREIGEARFRFSLPKSLYRYLSKLPASIERISLKIYRQLMKANIRAELSTHIDPESSRAFAHGYGVYVKEEEMIEHTISALKKERFIGGAWRKQDLYSGKQLKAMPDIVVLPNFERSYALRGDVIMPKSVLRRSFASHHPDGIVIVFDRGVQQPSWINGLRVYDIVPTALNFLGLETPRSTDGKAVELERMPS